MLEIIQSRKSELEDDIKGILDPDLNERKVLFKSLRCFSEDIRDKTPLGQRCCIESRSPGLMGMYMRVTFRTTVQLSLTGVLTLVDLMPFWQNTSCQAFSPNPARPVVARCGVGRQRPP